MMKKTITIVLISFLAITACDFLIAPPESAGQGSLTINFGAGESRALVLSDEVIASLRYDLVLTGPGGETISLSASAGESVSLTVALGEWEILAEAFTPEGVLAGSGSASITVYPGSNYAPVPMTASGDLGGGGDTPGEDNGDTPGEDNEDPPVYRISGTISKSEGGAAAGAAVRLTQDGTVTGTPVFTNENGEYTISGVSAGTYAIEVSLAGYATGTISAFAVSADVTGKDLTLNKQYAMTIQGPQDETITVDVVNSNALRDPPTKISFSGGEILTVMVEDASYNQEAGNLKWYVDGDEKTGTDNYLTIAATGYIIRTYTLTVMIKKNDLWYSGEATFTVIE
jgi:hypothetical protein